LPSKFYRPSEATQVKLLNLIQHLINNGMCASALYLAREHKVQFKPETLRSWARDTRPDLFNRRRRIYATLARQMAVPAQPVALEPAPPVPLSTRRHSRRFVRSPAKVA
jgi:hypothetical protein